MTSEKAVYLQAKHHLLYTMCIVFNLVVMTFFWLIFREESLNVHRMIEEYDWGKSVHLELVHSVPGASMFINTICTNCIMKKDNWKFITYTTVFYGLFCWLYYLITGVQQYSFLDYSNGQAFVTLFWINLAACAGYIVLCTLDEKIKPINESNSNIFTSN